MVGLSGVCLTKVWYPLVSPSEGGAGVNPHSLFLFPIAQHSIGHKGQSGFTFDRQVNRQWPTDFQLDLLMMLSPDVA